MSQEQFASNGNGKMRHEIPPEILQRIQLLETQTKILASVLNGVLEVLRTMVKMLREKEGGEDLSLQRWQGHACPTEEDEYHDRSTETRPWLPWVHRPSDWPDIPP